MFFSPARLRLVMIATMLSSAPGSRAQGSRPIEAPPSANLGKLLSPETCSTSGCHGGAEPKRNQYWAWSLHDVHSRSFATLTTPRSERMAEALKIERATTSTRCTSCHAPLHAVSPELPLAEAPATLGVSCASCHGTPENWLRSHTRSDYTHADRVAAGMRELRDPHARANACVACHQNIDPELINVGRHPELLFELDGQVQSQPKHWSDLAGSGAQAWFVGQAVALREISWALREQRTDAQRDTPRWEGLRWLLERAAPDAAVALKGRASATAFAETVPAAEALARAAAKAWAPGETRATLRRLAATHADFRATDVVTFVHASRAERLVLALDRLLAALPAAERPKNASARLDALFRLAQSKPDFAPGEFADALAEFAQAVEGIGG